MSRRNTATPEDIRASAEQVAASLEIAGIDPAKAIVLGGSALTMAGIRPAGDTEVMVASDDFQTMQTTRHTPGGLVIREKPNARHPFLETHPLHLPDDMLALDVTHPHDPQTHLPTPELDEAFLDRVASYERVHGYAFLPPHLVAAGKANTGRRKDRRDIKLVQKSLEAQKR